VAAKLKGTICQKSFSASGNPQFGEFLGENLPQDYDELKMNRPLGLFITLWKYSFLESSHC